MRAFIWSPHGAAVVVAGGASRVGGVPGVQGWRCAWWCGRSDGGRVFFARFLAAVAGWLVWWLSLGGFLLRFFGGFKCVAFNFREWVCNDNRQRRRLVASMLLAVDNFDCCLRRLVVGGRSDPRRRSVVAGGASRCTHAHTHTHTRKPTLEHQTLANLSK